jgi:hypothetical protein
LQLNQTPLGVICFSIRHLLFSILFLQAFVFIAA